MRAGPLRYPLRGGDEGDGALGVPGVGAQRGGDVADTAEAKQSDHQVAQSGHYLGGSAGSDLAAVLVEGNIPHPVQAVLDAPVSSHEVQQLRGRCLLRGEAGDEIGRLHCGLPLAPAQTGQPAHLCQTRPLRPFVQVAGDRQFAPLQAIPVSGTLPDNSGR